MNVAATSPRPSKSAVDHLVSTTCLLLAIGLPLAAAWSLQGDGFVQALAQGGLPASLAAADSGWRAPAVRAVALLPVCLLAWGLCSASLCFRAFGRGEYFSRFTVLKLKGLGGAACASSLASLLATPAISLLMSGHGGAPHSLSVNVGSQPLLLMLFGGIVWQISAVMSRGLALAEENAQFV